MPEHGAVAKTETRGVLTKLLCDELRGGLYRIIPGLCSGSLLVFPNQSDPSRYRMLTRISSVLPCSLIALLIYTSVTSHVISVLQSTHLPFHRSLTLYVSHHI